MEYSKVIRKANELIACADIDNNATATLNYFESFIYVTIVYRSGYADYYKMTIEYFMSLNINDFLKKSYERKQKYDSIN